MIDLLVAALTVSLAADLAPPRPAPPVEKGAQWTAITGAPQAPKGSRLIWTHDGKSIWTAVVGPDGKSAGARRSNDCGKTWSKAASIAKPPDGLHGSGGVLYARAKEGVVESKDQGKSWTPVKLPQGETYAVMATPSGARWALSRWKDPEYELGEHEHEDAAYETVLYRSEKPGAAWKEKARWLHRSPRRLLVFGEDVIAGLEKPQFIELQNHRVYADGREIEDRGKIESEESPEKIWGAGKYFVQTYIAGSRVSVSTDLGNTFVTADLGDLPKEMLLNEEDPAWILVNDVDASGDTLWLSTDIGMRYSTDAGKTWTPYAEGTGVGDFAFCGSSLITARKVDDKFTLYRLDPPAK